MLVEAVRLASEGTNVIIAGYNHRYSLELVNTAKRMCDKCGVDSTLIHFSGKYNGYSRYVLLRDHYKK